MHDFHIFLINEFLRPIFSAHVFQIVFLLSFASDLVTKIRPNFLLTIKHLQLKKYKSKSDTFSDNIQALCMFNTQKKLEVSIPSESKDTRHSEIIFVKCKSIKA